MEYTYKPKGVCSSGFIASIGDDGIIESLSVIGGCDGNGKGMSRLVQGRHIDEVIALLSGITCGRKKTSCPDQCAKMLAAYKEETAMYPDKYTKEP